MLLLYHALVVVVIICRAVFFAGIAVTRAMPDNNHIVSTNAIDDYSYVNARRGTFTGGTQIARCVTGLGPNDTDDNSALGGVYFDENRLPFETCGGTSRLVHPRAALLSNLGVINIIQCSSPFTTALEGIYTCTMMNSSMMEQSVRFGVYFTGRSEYINLYTYPITHLTIFLSLYIAAPVIETPSSFTVTVTAGSSLTLNCTSSGSPPDTFTWMKDNSSTLLQSTNITAVEYTSTSAVFHADYSTDCVTASDSGTYTCTVTNPIGSDSATITVVVIGKLLM